LLDREGIPWSRPTLHFLLATAASIVSWTILFQRPPELRYFTFYTTWKKGDT
jgi:hypothetical protein